MNKLNRYLKSYFMEITNKKSVYQHILNFIKIIYLGYYKHIYFYIILHDNKLGYYKHRYFLLSYSKLSYKSILVTVTQSITNVPQTNNTSTSGMNEE